MEKKTETDVVELAAKKRHLFLLEKIRQGKTLTAIEVKELERYEQDMPAGKSKGKSGRKKTGITAAAVKLAAMESANIAQAEVGFGFVNLADKIKKEPKIKRAWERGVLLKNVRGLASTAATISEAEEALELEDGRLKEMLATDVEVRNVWNQTRLNMIIAVKTALVSEAKKGRPSAAKQVEAILRREISRPKIDYSHLTIPQMVEITGKTRQTIHDWYTKHGLPRNSDKSFNLTEFFVWFEEFVVQKISSGRISIRDTDPLKAIKAEKLATELERQKGQLLDRSQVMAGILARHQLLVNTLERKSDDLAMLCYAQSHQQISQILHSFFDELRKQLCSVPEVLHLPPAAAKQFMVLLESLGAVQNGETSGQ